MHLGTRMCIAMLAACAAATPVHAAAQPASPPTLNATARVRYIVEYPACQGLRRDGEGPMPPGLRGLSRAAIARMLTPATVQLSPDQLTVTRTLPGCPTDTVTLTVQDGVVVVLAGPPGDNPAVLLRTPILIRGLAPEDAARLAAGWGVRTTDLSATLRQLAGTAPAQPSD